MEIFTIAQVNLFDAVTDVDVTSDPKLCSVKIPYYCTGLYTGFDPTLFCVQGGFALVGSEKAKCRDGKWSSRTPVCTGTVNFMYRYVTFMYRYGTFMYRYVTFMYM